LKKWSSQFAKVHCSVCKNTLDSCLSANLLFRTSSANRYEKCLSLIKTGLISSAGKVKLTVVSTQGKEAVIAVFGIGSFFGESCLIGQAVRLSTATALEASSILRIPKAMMLQVLSEEPTLLELFYELSLDAQYAR
jgi:hypothetical protein